jgi:hypothetical protein
MIVIAWRSYSAIKCVSSRDFGPFNVELLACSKDSRLELEPRNRSERLCKKHLARFDPMLLDTPEQMRVELQRSVPPEKVLQNMPSELRRERHQ